MIRPGIGIKSTYRRCYVTKCINNNVEINIILIPGWKQPTNSEGYYVYIYLKTIILKRSVQCKW